VTTDEPVREFLKSLGPMTPIGVPTPTRQEMERFIEVFDKLVSFEAEQRNIRGYGLFPDGPVPEVMTVSRWLSNFVKVLEDKKR